MEQMPPMDMQTQMGNDMGGDFMPQGDMMPMNGGEQMPNQFDTNFDAGVEADEEQDPKRYIQQLTGKLSQSLQKFTENNGQPDIDLNKYVAGMITKQAMKGLSEQDAEEIIDKVKADEDFSMDDGGNEQQDGGEIQQGDMSQQVQPQMNENFSQMKKARDIKEIVNGVLDNKPMDTPHQQPKNGGYKRSVFSSPKFS